jgi:hypothetical protein
MPIPFTPRSPRPRIRSPIGYDNDADFGCGPVAEYFRDPAFVMRRDVEAVRATEDVPLQVGRLLPEDLHDVLHLEILRMNSRRQLAFQFPPSTFFLRECGSLVHPRVVEEFASDELGLPGGESSGSFVAIEHLLEYQQN